MGDGRDWRLSVADVMPLIEAGRSYRRHVLDNGLTVILKPVATTSLVHLSVTYRVGAMDEAPGGTGIAHFLEHMMFSGTSALPGSYVRRMLDAGAVEVNAVTMRDMTRYFQTVPAHLVDLVLFAEADRMTNFADSLDDAIIERERNVVLEEKRETEGRPFGKGATWLSEGLLSVGHPYHHPTIGYEADILRYNADALREWHATHYGPSNAILVLTGGFDPDSMLDSVERYFASVPARRAPLRIEARLETAPRQSVIRASDWIDVPRYHLQAWNTPSSVATPRENLALALAADLIGSGEASPLRRRLVDTLGLASEVNMSLTPGRANGMVLVQAALVGSTTSLDLAIDDVISSFVATSVPAEEMDRLRIRRLVKTARALTNFEHVAALLASGEGLHGNAGWFLDEARLIAALEEDEIRAAAGRWLGGNSLTLVIDRAVAPAPQTAVAATPPPLGDPTHLPVNVPAWREVRLKSGARLRVSQRSGDPLFQMRVVGASGQISEPEGLEGVAMLVASVTSFGAGPDDAATFAERTARTGLSVGMIPTPSALLLDVSGVIAALPSAASIVADVVLRPRYGTPDYVRRLTALTEEAATENAPSQRATRTLRKALLGPSHRLATYASVTPSLAERLTPDAVIDFHGHVWDPAGTVLLLAGDIDVERARAMLDAMLEGWTGPSSSVSAPRTMVMPMPPGIRAVASPEESVEIAVCWIVPVENLDDEAAIACLMHMLAGHFGSRANRLLREAHGWTYGVSGTVGELVQGFGPTRAQITATISPDRVADVLRAIEALIEGLRSDSPPALDEIESFRRGERQRLARLNETAARAVATMQDILVREPSGRADRQAYRNRIEMLDPGTLAVMARRLLPAPGMLTGTVLGKPDRIKAALESSGAAVPTRSGSND